MKEELRTMYLSYLISHISAHVIEDSEDCLEVWSLGNAKLEVLRVPCWVALDLSVRAIPGVDDLTSGKAVDVASSGATGGRTCKNGKRCEGKQESEDACRLEAKEKHLGSITWFVSKGEYL